MQPSPIAMPTALFTPARLSVGLALPIQAEGRRDVDVSAQLALARQADALGFDALWVRDVPLNHPDYPDPVGHPDPWVFLGALASHTQRIHLATGAIVLTLRHPLHIAKGARSVAALAPGRLVLGLGSGDRPPEYAAFGVDGDARRERYRQHWGQLAAALAEPADVRPAQPSSPPVHFDLGPRLDAAVPLLAVGSAGQSVDWIARHAIGWMTYHREPEVQRDRHAMWRAAVARVAGDGFRGFGVAMRLWLAEARARPAEPAELGYRTGPLALIDILHGLRELGAHHVSLNLADTARAPADVIAQLASDVLPHVRE
ncbi:TIGR03571 family LLM class oxidoreductase [Verticiella sediminum]|uniref:TIGR03571 family LLM class oxidoreductase n=1 Tax=Verticiella sediminum TaxID=1247510 RepID=A0A556AZE8_9BURK|nr:TIGR03571 family LLM class oxidoreductase [Verticiella sediminum]TSH98307.1 TIGR03571 family LLM class oxidoreductase [Verticiella sediminum]